MDMELGVGSLLTRYKVSRETCNFNGNGCLVAEEISAISANAGVDVLRFNRSNWNEISLFFIFFGDLSNKNFTKMKIIKLNQAIPYL